MMATLTCFILPCPILVVNEYESVRKVRPAWYLCCLIKGSDIQLADWQVRNVALFIGCALHEANFLHVIIHLPGIGISDKLSTAMLVGYCTPDLAEVIKILTNYRVTFSIKPILQCK